MTDAINDKTSCPQLYLIKKQILYFSLNLYDSTARTVINSNTPANEIEQIIRASMPTGMSWGLAFETCSHIWPELNEQCREIYLPVFSWYPILVTINNNIDKAGSRFYVGIRSVNGGNGQITPSYDLHRTSFDKDFCKSLEDAIANHRHSTSDTDYDLIWNIQYIKQNSSKKDHIIRDHPTQFGGSSASAMIAHIIGKELSKIKKRY
jgi:hypothetical protein